MRRKAAFWVSIVTLGRPLVSCFGYWPTLPLHSTVTGMYVAHFYFFFSLFLLAYRHLTSFSRFRFRELKKKTYTQNRC